MRSKSEAGFMMVETLTAAALAAIVGAGLVAALSSAHARSAEARTRAAALRQAEALIDEARQAPADLALPAEGRAPALKWTRSIEPMGEAYPTLDRIAVTVAWTAGRKQGETHLEAVRVQPKPAR